LSIVRIARIAAWCLVLAITLLSVVPAGLRPETAAPHDVEHFAIFFAAGLAFAVGYEHRHLLMAILFVLYAAAIETIQLFIPGRHARLSDFIVDAAAMCAGLFVVNMVGRSLRFRAQP
jgi:VanZ family protein